MWRNMLPIKLVPHFSLSALGSFCCALHNTRYLWIYVPFEGHSINGLLTCLRTRVPRLDSNPHSADQNHQSLSLVLLSARPKHTTEHNISKWSWFAYILSSSLKIFNFLLISGLFTKMAVSRNLNANKTQRKAWLDAFCRSSFRQWNKSLWMKMYVI